MTATNEHEVDPVKGAKRPPIEGRKTLSDQIRRAIESYEVPVARVARAAKVDAKVLGRFMAGERGLTLASADRLAVALKLRLKDNGEAPPKLPRKKRAKAAAASKAE